MANQIKQLIRKNLLAFLPALGLLALSSGAMARQITLDEPTLIRRESHGFTKKITLPAGTVIEVPDSEIKNLKATPGAHRHRVFRPGEGFKPEYLLSEVKVVKLPEGSPYKAKDFNSQPNFLSLTDSASLQELYPVRSAQPKATPQTAAAVAAPAEQVQTPLTPAEIVARGMGLPPETLQEDKPTAAAEPVEAPDNTVAAQAEAAPGVAPEASQETQPETQTSAAEPPVAEPQVQEVAAPADPAANSQHGEGDGATQAQPQVAETEAPAAEPRSVTTVPPGKLYPPVCGCKDCSIQTPHGAQLDPALVKAVGEEEAVAAAKDINHGNSYSAPARVGEQLGEPFRAPCDGQVVSRGLHDTWGGRVVYQCELAPGEHYQFVFHHIHQVIPELKSQPNLELMGGDILGFIGNRKTGPDGSDGDFRLDHKIFRVKNPNEVADLPPGSDFSKHPNVIESIDPSYFYAGMDSNSVVKVGADGTQFVDVGAAEKYNSRFLQADCPLIENFRSEEPVAQPAQPAQPAEPAQQNGSVK